MKRDLSILEIIKVAVAKMPSKGMTKVADKNESEFNETVPAPESQPVDQQFAEMQGNAPAPKKAVPTPSLPQGQAQEEEYAAVPMEGEAEAGGIEGSPEEIGVRAAQAFIGDDIMNMALQGDPNAADLIARTAGHVAGAVSESAAKALMALQGAVAPVEGGMPAEAQGMPAGAAPMGAQPAASVMTTPEEDLANEIVPNVQEMPAQAAPAQNGAPASQAPQVGKEGTGDPRSGSEAGKKTQSGNGGNPESGEAKEVAEDENLDPDTVAKIVKMVKSGKL